MLVTLKKEFMGQPAGKTVDVSDGDAKTLIAQEIAVTAQSDTINQLMQKSLETAVAGITKNLDTIITAALNQFKEAQAGARKHAVPAIFGNDGGDPQHCFGDWLKHVAIATTTGGRVDRKASIDKLEKGYGSAYNVWQKAAMGESSGSTGGYITPPEFYQDLLAVAAENNTFRQHAFVQPMGSETFQFPYLAVTDVQAAGVSPFFGGVKCTWTAEAQTRTETEPKFKMMELKANELSGYSVSSNILLQDAAFGLEKFLKTLFGVAIGWTEEYAFLQGNGVGKPLGVLNSPAAIAVTRGTSSHFTFVDYRTMFSKLLPSSYKNAFWYISPTVVADLFNLKDDANRVLWTSIDQGAMKPPVWKLNGANVIVTEKIPALGTKGDVMLIDPSLYVIGDRMMLEIAASEHVNFLNNQMTWRFVQRVDGRPWLDKYVTLQDGTSQVSAFVILN